MLPWKRWTNTWGLQIKRYRLRRQCQKLWWTPIRVLIMWCQKLRWTPIRVFDSVTPEITMNIHTCVNNVGNISHRTSSISESVSGPAELYWKRRIALAALTDATNVSSEVCSKELSIVSESTYTVSSYYHWWRFWVWTSELDHHTSDNIISENLSVAGHSIDIPDEVGVDTPTKKTGGEFPKFHNVFELQPKGIIVVCDFCPFESNCVKEFHQHLREVHGNTYGYGSRWTYSDNCSGQILPKVISC